MKPLKKNIQLVQKIRKHNNVAKPITIFNTMNMITVSLKILCEANTKITVLLQKDGHIISHDWLLLQKEIKLAAYKE